MKVRWRYWQDAFNRGMKIKEYQTEIGWLLFSELQEITGLSRQAMEKRIERGSDLLAEKREVNEGTFHVQGL